MYLLLIWSTIVVGAGLVVLLGMAMEYNKHHTKGR
jgi:hypothetical protein